MAKLELFGTAGCQQTQEMREWLEWRGDDFVEYDVEADLEARQECVPFRAGSEPCPSSLMEEKLFRSGGKAAAALLASKTSLGLAGRLKT